MQLNLNAGNSNTEKVLRVIKKNNPDLLLLEEVTPQWAKALSGLSTNYPHQISEPQTDCFGIILLSKVPLKQGKIVDIGSTGVPSIVAEAHFPLGTITVIGTHPLPPISANYSAKRNQLLAALPQLIKEQHYPVLLMGDLNLSPWSPYFKQLLRDSELKNSMKGFGFQPSWPSRIHLLRIPLDHLLYSSEIRIHSRQIGENVGSDHFPLFVEFSIPPKK
jgi:endonuclease/exonuclease/phosphatase (EEP) superfamily protein YafD